MNWIKLLYPRPQFTPNGLPTILWKIHSRVLLISYYITQTLALLGLSLVYLSVVLPLSAWIKLRGSDPLRRSLEPDTKSYLLPSRPVEEIDFKRMF